MCLVLNLVIIFFYCEVFISLKMKYITVLNVMAITLTTLTFRVDQKEILIVN